MAEPLDSTPSSEWPQRFQYRSSLDHIFDELSSLDIRILRRIAIQRASSPDDAFDQLRGLVITNAEVDTLLSSELKFADAHSTSSTFADLLDQRDCHDREIAARIAEAATRSIVLGLCRLTSLFGLSRFQQQCVVLSLAPEFDRKYDRLFAYLHDDVTQKSPSVDLALTLFCDTQAERCSMRSAFEQDGTLVKFGLLDLIHQDSRKVSPLLSRSLKLNDRVVSYLLGREDCKATLDVFRPSCLTNVPVEQATISPKTRERLCSVATELRAGIEPNAIFCFHGRYGCGQVAVAEEICRAADQTLLVVDAERVVRSGLQNDASKQLMMEAKLQSSGICFLNADALLGDESTSSLLDELLKHVRLVFLLTSHDFLPAKFTSQNVIDVPFPEPSTSDRRELWNNALHEQGYSADVVDVDALATAFRFTPGQITDAANFARNYARIRLDEGCASYSFDLYEACRKVGHCELGRLARRLEPCLGWDDIVLPDEQMEQLRELANRIKYRSVVLENWGFARKESRGLGLSVLFAGPPGTGKTMAAEVLAHETGLELYKIDLAQVVSKYIGETEKNLRQIFDAASHGNVILFFDEADALFGKRTEIKDSHDRYANVETAYLLQQMEEYDGVAILSTNLRQNIDQAFFRRLQVIVDFPFPDALHRRRIWDTVFPVECPLGSDIDFELLATEVHLAGSGLKNIAIAAAHYAASDGGIIRLDHIRAAASKECRKMGRGIPSLNGGDRR